MSKIRYTLGYYCKIRYIFLYINKNRVKKITASLLTPLNRVIVIKTQTNL